MEEILGGVLTLAFMVVCLFSPVFVGPMVEGLARRRKAVVDVA